MTTLTARPNGATIVVVPAGEKIALNCTGNSTAIIYYSTVPSLQPEVFYEATRLSNTTTTLGTFDADRTVRIEAGADPVLYSIGTAPTVVAIDRSFSSVKQGAPTAKTVSATLTAAEVIAGIITVNQGAAGASALQLPLATAMDTALPDFAAGDAFDFSVTNISTVAAEDASLTTNTGWTLVGNMDIASNAAATDISVGRFRARKTAAGAWSLYRIG